MNQIIAQLKEFEKNPRPYSSGGLGVSLQLLDKVCGGEGNRHTLFRKLFGVETGSATELSNRQKSAVVQWVSPAKIDNIWVCRSTLRAEVMELMKAIRNESQIETTPENN